MTLAVRNSRATVATNPSFVAAGADIPEANAAQRIASDPSVIDAERDPLYGDRVKHATTADPRWAPLLQVEYQMYLANVRREAESLRQSRLSRWQEQR